MGKIIEFSDNFFVEKLAYGYKLMHQEGDSSNKSEKENGFIIKTEELEELIKMLNKVSISQLPREILSARDK